MSEKMWRCPCGNYSLEPQVYAFLEKGNPICPACKIRTHNQFVLDQQLAKFVVYDNDVLAQYPDCEVHPSWKKCSFDNLPDAVNYADMWLGHLSPGKEFLVLNIVDKPYDYNDYHNTIEIRTVKE